MIPMERDLRFAWEEMPQQMLDAQAQKVREGLHAALIQWAESAGEGADYTDNVPMQCLHPVGHWYEIANLLRNGTLLQLLAMRPQLGYLMVHNIDTAGANVDSAILGHHIQSGAAHDNRGDCAPPRRPRRRPGPSGWPGSLDRRPGAAQRRAGKSACAITTAQPTGSISIACSKSSA